MREEAETRLRELSADTETVRRERSDLLDNLRVLATRVAGVAGAADERFPPSKRPDQAEEGNPPVAAADEGAAAGTTTDETTAEAETRQRPPA